MENFEDKYGKVKLLPEESFHMREKHQEDLPENCTFTAFSKQINSFESYLQLHHNKERCGISADNAKSELQLMHEFASWYATTSILNKYATNELNLVPCDKDICSRKLEMHFQQQKDQETMMLTTTRQHAENSKAIETAGYFVNCLKSKSSCTYVSEQHLWELAYEFLYEMQLTYKYHGEKIKIQHIPSHRRWFVSHYAYIQHLLLSSPTLRAFNLICKWLERCYWESHNTSSLPALNSTLFAQSHAMTDLSQSNVILFLEYIFTCIRGGAFNKAIAAAWRTNNCTYSCLLNAAQLESVREPWMNETEVVILFSEYGHSVISSESSVNEEESNNNNNSSSRYSSDCTWYGNERRLENLSFLYEKVQEHKELACVSAVEPTSPDLFSVSSTSSSTLSSSSTCNQLTVSSVNATNKASGNEIDINNNNINNDNNNNNIIKDNVHSAERSHGLKATEHNKLTRQWLETMISATLCGEVTFLSSLFTSDGSWQDVVWSELRCALILAINRTLIEGNVNGFTDEYAKFVYEQTKPATMGKYENDDNNEDDDTNECDDTKNNNSSHHNTPKWLRRFEQNVVSRITTYLTNCLASDASISEKLQIRLIIYILSESIKRHHSEANINPFDLDTVDLNVLSSVRLTTHMLLLLNTAHAEKLTIFSIQFHCKEVFTESLIAYGLALVKSSCSSNHTLLSKFEVDSIHDNDNKLKACVKLFSSVLMEIIAMSNKLHSSVHRARIYARLLFDIRHEIMTRKWLAPSSLIDCEGHLIKQILLVDNNVNNSNDNKELQKQLSVILCKTHSNVLSEEQNKLMLELKLNKEITPSKLAVNLLTSSIFVEELLWALWFAQHSNDLLLVIQDSLHACMHNWSSYISSESNIDKLCAIDEIVNIIFSRLPLAVPLLNNINNDNNELNNTATVTNPITERVFSLPQLVVDAIQFWHLFTEVRQICQQHSQSIEELNLACPETPSLISLLQSNRSAAYAHTQQFSFTTMNELMCAELKQLMMVKELATQLLDRSEAIITNTLASMRSGNVVLFANNHNTNEVDAIRREIVILLVFIVELFTQQVTLRIEFESALFAKFNTSCVLRVAECKHSNPCNDNVDHENNYDCLNGDKINNFNNSNNYTCMNNVVVNDGDSDNNNDANAMKTNLLSQAHMPRFHLCKLLNFTESDRHVNELMESVMMFVVKLDEQGYLKPEYISTDVGSRLYDSIRVMRITALKRAHQRHSNYLL